MKRLWTASAPAGWLLAATALAMLAPVDRAHAAAQCNARPLPLSQTAIPEGTLVTLDGSGSTPKSGNAINSYVWSQPAGQGIVFQTNNAATGIATFVAPLVGPSGRALTFSLTVNGPGCSGANTASTVINVTDVVTNSPPWAIASTSPEPASEGDTVMLDGSASYDPDGTALSYAWTQVAGSPTLAITNANGAVATVVAPNTAYPLGTSFTFRLTVSDGALSAQTDKIVTVKWINDKPTAVLTCPATVNEGGSVTLSAAGSSDPEGAALAYDWTQLDGPPYLLSGVFTPTQSISFTAPQLGYLQTGFLPFRVVVSDGTMSDAKECTVEILDITPPVLSGAVNQALEATSPAGAVATFNVYGTDNVDGGPLAATCSRASGSTFALGATTVDCSAQDTRHNVGTASFIVTVADNIAPVIDAHDDVTEEATGPAGNVVGYIAPATSDAVDGPGVASCDPAPGSLFAIASTPVTCTASDAKGNVATPRVFNVIVQDTTAPGITPPGNVTKEATGLKTPVDYGLATGTDVVGPVTITSNAPADGLFPVGTTDITWKATDGHNNSSIAHSFVTVTDNTPPTVDDLVNQVLEATSADGAAATFDAPAAHDLVDGDLASTCDATSGATFPLGVTTVTCSAEDSHHNTGSSSFTITVEDTTEPTVTVPGDITKEATSAAGASASFTSTAEDIVDGTVATTCTPASGSTFALGTTLVTCTATDHAGNTGSGSFNVIVEDTTAPTVSVPANMTVEATGSTGAAASFSATASDIVDGALAASCAPASGSTFALGTTLVTCSATDHANNTGTASFNVTVRDTTAPALTLPGNQTAEATGPSGAAVSWAASATDLVDGSVPPVCVPASGSTFAIATTAVNCSATDHAGNTASGSFNVTVQDTTKPIIASHPDVVVNATSGAGAIVTYTNPTATDLVDGTVAVTCSPASGTQFALGSTTVTCTATDSHNNTQTSSFKVIVSFNFSGFFKPIDNLPIVNVVKAGQAVPVKFSLGGNMGLNIFAAGYPASIATACNANPQDAVEETVTAGGSSLSYDATTGQYIYVWKTDKSWAGACRQLVVKLADGSTTKVAMFNFTR